MSLNFNAWWIMGDRPFDPLGRADKVRAVRHQSDSDTLMAWSDPTTNRLELRRMTAALTPGDLGYRDLNPTLGLMWDACEGIDDAAHVFYVDNAPDRNVRHLVVGGLDDIVVRPSSYKRYDDGNPTPVTVPLAHEWFYSTLSCAPGVPASVLRPNTPTWNPPEYSIEDWKKARYMRQTWMAAVYEQWDKTQSKYQRFRWIAPQYEVTQMEGKTQDAAPGTYRRETRSVSLTGGPYLWANDILTTMPRTSSTTPTHQEMWDRAMTYLSATYPNHYFIGQFDTLYVTYYTSTQWRLVMKPWYYTAVFGAWTVVGNVQAWGPPANTSTDRYFQVTAPKAETWIGLTNRPNGMTYLGYRQVTPQTWITDNNTHLGLWPGQWDRIKAGTGVWVAYGFVYAYTQPANTTTYQYYLVESGYWYYVQDVTTDSPPANTVSREYRLKRAGFWQDGYVVETDNPPADTTTVRYVKLSDGYWQLRDETLKTDTPPVSTTTVRYTLIRNGYWTRTFQAESYPNSYYLSVGGESIAVINHKDGTLHYSVETHRHRNYAFNRELILTAMGRGYSAGVSGLWVAPVNNWPLDEGHRQTLAQEGIGSHGVCLIADNVFGALSTTHIGRLTNTGAYVTLSTHSLPIQTVHRGGRDGWFLVTLVGGSLSMVKVNFNTAQVERVVELFTGFGGDADHADYTHVGISIGYVILIDPMDGVAKYTKINFNHPDLLY